MDHKTIQRLEGDIEQAIAEVIMRLGLKRLPLLPSRRTMHLMAKAAVALRGGGRRRLITTGASR
jgi:hypothetical protein